MAGNWLCEMLCLPLLRALSLGFPVQMPWTTAFSVCGEGSEFGVFMHCWVWLGVDIPPKDSETATLANFLEINFILNSLNTTGIRETKS